MKDLQVDGDCAATVSLTGNHVAIANMNGGFVLDGTPQ